MSGNGAGAFAMMNVGGIEYAYVPNGSYLETSDPVLNPDVSAPAIGGVNYNGVSVVPLSATSGTRTEIATPDAVNSCAGNPNTGKVVCTSNHNDIYIIDSATNTITATLRSGGNPSFPFYSSGGACITCGVTVNPVTNTAIIGVSENPTANSGMSGYQVLDLSNNTLGPVFHVTGNHIAESWSVDTDRSLLLSPTENVGPLEPDLSGNSVSGDGPWNLTHPAQLHLFDLSNATPAQFDLGSPDTLFNPINEPDAVAQDSSGIAVATLEFTGNLLLTDLSQASRTGGNPGTWSAPSQLQYLPELGPSEMFQPFFPQGPLQAMFTSGGTAISIATGTHYGFLEDEFGAGSIGAFIMQSSPKPGQAPVIEDYVFASMPNDPVTQAPWQNPFDPHGLAAAYVTIGSGNAYGVLMNSTYNAVQASASASADGNSTIRASRSSIAVVSLPGLLAAPRVSGCAQNAVPIASITESGSTVTVTTASPHGFSAGQTVTIGDLYSGWVEDPSGKLGYNGTFTIASVPDSTSFTYENSVTGLADAVAGADLFAGANATVDICTPNFSGHFVDPSYDLVANGVIRFFPIH